MKHQLEKEQKELQNELERLGYEDLRTSLLKQEDEDRREFQYRIDYDQGKYSIYKTSERAGLSGNVFTTDNFKEAKKDFFIRVQAMINYNRLMVEDGEPPQYPCSIWRSGEGKKKVAFEENELLKELEKRGYADLRVSLFRPMASNIDEWQVRLDYEYDRYFVYRLGNKGRHYNQMNTFENDEFEEAKEDFFKQVEEMVSENKKRVKWRRKPRYASVIWDKSKK